MRGRLLQEVCLAILITAIAVGVMPAAACQCLPPTPIEEAVAGAQRIFRGVVISTRAAEDGSNERIATVRVYAYWKDSTGEYLSEVEVRDPAGWMCPSGIAGEHMEGFEWLVLAESDVSGLRTDECLHTMQWHHAESEGLLEAIGDPMVVPIEGEGIGMLKALHLPHRH